MEKKPSGVAEVGELEERQARLAAREAKKQERLKSKLARESRRAEEGWIDECKRGKQLEEAEQQRREVKAAEVVHRTQEQYQRMSEDARAVPANVKMSKWQRAVGAPRSEKEDASAEGSQTWQKSMLDASTLATEKSKDETALDVRYNWGRQSKYLQANKEAGISFVGWSAYAQELLLDLQREPQDWWTLQEFPPIEKRKVRILALHGTPGNSNIMKFATTQLRKAIGNTKVEWLFLEAPNVWEPKAHSNRPSEEPISEFEKRIANGQPFLSWMDYSFDGQITNAEECCEYLEEQCNKLAPIDFVVAFSQAANLVSIFIDKLRKRGEAVPWRLSIFFCGGQLIQPSYIFRQSHPHPIMATYGGDKDAYALMVRTWVPAMFSDLQLFEHQDGHVFPTTQPRAAEIYNAIAAQIWKSAYVEEVD